MGMDVEGFARLVAAGVEGMADKDDIRAVWRPGTTPVVLVAVGPEQVFRLRVYEVKDPTDKAIARHGEKGGYSD